MSLEFYAGLVTGGAAAWWAGNRIAMWLRGELRNGATCRFGHDWQRVREYDLGAPSRAWECERCQTGIDAGSRLSDRILWRVGLGRWARGKGLVLYAGTPGTLHVASWLLRGAPVRASHGFRLPRGYGIAWRDPARLETICAPVPINWAYAAAWGLWWRILVRPPWMRKLELQEAELHAKEDELRRSELELRALCAHMRREIDAGRAMSRQFKRDNGVGRGSNGTSDR